MINLTVVIDNDEAVKKLKELQNVAKTTTSSVVKDSERMDASWQKMKDTLMSLAAGVSFAALAKQVVQIRGEVQQLEVAFETMLGSKKQADTLMTEIIDLAAKTPFGLQDVSNATKMLLAYGSTAEQVTDEIKMLGNIASGLSIPLNDMIYLYGTTRTQGQMFTQDLRQFMGRGIPLAEELAKIFGVTKAEVGELVSKGEVGFEQMAQALSNMTSEGGQFNDLMDKQSQTIAGQISNLEDAIYQMFNELGEKNEGLISSVLSGTSWAVENYEKLLKVIVPVIAAYGAYKAALIAIAAYQKVKAIIASTQAFFELAKTVKTAKDAMLLFNTVTSLNPWAIIAAGVVSLITAFSMMGGETEELTDKTNEYIQARDAAIAKEDEHKRKMDELARVAGDEAESTEDRRRALVALEMQYPDIFAQYDTEIDKLNNIKRIKEEIAAYEGKKSIANPEVELKDVEAQIDAMARKYKEIYSEAFEIGVIRNLHSDEDWEKIKQLQQRQQELYVELFKRDVQDTISNADTLSDEAVAETLEKLKTERGRRNRIATGAGRYDTMDILPGELLISDLTTDSEFASWSDDFIQAYIQSLEGVKAERAKPNLSAKQRVEAAAKAWVDAEKEYEDFLASKTAMSEKEYQEKLKQLDEARKKAKTEAEAAGVSTTKSGTTGGAGQNKKTAEDDKKRKLEQAGEMERQLAQQNIDDETALMEEGVEKKLKQIDDEYARRMAAITKNEAELRKLQGGKLTEAQQAELEKSRQLADQKRKADRNATLDESMKAELLAMDEYLINLGTLQEKIRATKSKYERDIADALTEGERMALEAERDALLAEYQVAASDWAKELTDKTAVELNKMLAELQAQVEAKEQAFNALDSSDSEDAKKYRDELNKLKAQIAVLKDELGKTSRNAGDKNWDDAVQTFQNIANSAMEAADGIAKFDEDLGNTLRSIAQLASTGLNLVVVIKKITDAAWTGAAAISAMEKASLILAAISAAIQVVSALFNLFRKSDEVEQTKRQFKELNDELERLHKLARIDNVEGTIFGANPFGNFINNLKAMQDALKDFEASKEAIRDKDAQYMEVVAGWNADGSPVMHKIPQGRQNLNDAISNMQVMTKHKTWFTDREYEDLGNLYPGLFDESGNVTLEGLQNLKNSDVWEKLGKKDRELIEQMIADWEDYNAAVEATNKYLSDVFGDLGDDITNALLDSFKSGTDAAEAFGEATGKILERLAQDIVNMALIQPILDEAEAEVLELQKKLNAGEITYDEYLRQTKAIVDKAANKAKDRVDDASEIYEAAGIEKGSGSTQATSKGFQTMSQETGSELNGRFTDIQGQTHRIAEAVEFCKSLHIENLTQVQSINATVAMIHNDTSLIAQHTRALAQMQDDLASIRRSMDNGAI